jgi:phage gp36-like protein
MSNYATIQSILDILDTNTLLQLTDDQGVGMVQEPVIQQALDNAGAEIDAILHLRFTLPLPSDHVGSGLLHGLQVSLALYNLYARRGYEVSDTLQRRYDNAQMTLGHIRDGKLSLGADDPRGPRPVGDARVFHKQPPRQWGRRS